METRKNFSNGDIQVLDIEGKPPCNQQATADAFNNYFLSKVTQLPRIIHIIILGITKILLPLLSIVYHKFLKIPLLLRGFNPFQLKELQV